MAMNMIIYVLVTILVAVILAVQITIGRGNLVLLTLLSIFSAALVALFNMQLKDENIAPVGIILLPPLILAIIFGVGMIIS
jgi:hypothetical protein|tara:strand:- start:422 stop:664 length:243 start_codon:yes stop_codon:yes gene_type:complete